VTTPTRTCRTSRSTTTTTEAWGGGDAAKIVRQGDGEGIEYGYATSWVKHTPVTRDVTGYTASARNRLEAAGLIDGECSAEVEFPTPAGPIRLDAELVGNVSIRVSPTESPDTWEVQGRGELALAVLVETMRREGFELTVGKPQVVTRTVDGTLHEPFEHLTVDVPEEYVGAVTQLLAARKGRTEQLGATSGDGWVRLEFTVPSRGLIGFRTEFLTITRGTGVVHHVFDGYRPWVGELRTRRSGSLVADRSGAVTGYALTQLADRGTFFVEPGAAVYAGMVVGENPRAEDLDLNVCRERKLTNVRSSSGEELERLARPRTLGLGEALEFCASGECVEVAPDVVRVRKVMLDATQRGRQRVRDRVARGPSTSSSAVAAAMEPRPISRRRAGSVKSVTEEKGTITKTNTPDDKPAIRGSRPTRRYIDGVEHSKAGMPDKPVERKNKVSQKTRSRHSTASDNHK